MVFGRFLQTLIKRGYIPDVVLYSIIIDGFVKALKLQEALRLYHKMLHEGINPNLFTYTSLINGLSRDDRLPEAMELMRNWYLTRFCAHLSLLAIVGVQI